MLQRFSDGGTELLKTDMGERRVIYEGQMHSYKPSPTN